jgi:XTP/dITP diphosphohydrolase
MPAPLQLVVASANPDKAAEMRDLLSVALGDKVELVDRPSSVGDVEEDGATLEENARLKADALCQATGLPAVADDTGLEVRALEGRPGIFAARYAGPDATYADNVAKLLAELDGVADRAAVFRTVALVAFPDGSELIAEGTMSGTISMAPRGAGGFGYDSVFLPFEGEGRTLGEMSLDEKHAISHRGRAFRALAVLLDDRLR